MIYPDEKMSWHKWKGKPFLPSSPVRNFKAALHFYHWLETNLNYCDFCGIKTYLYASFFMQPFDIRDASNLADRVWICRECYEKINLEL